MHDNLVPPASVEKRMSICSQEVFDLNKSKVEFGSITEITDDRPSSPIPFKREPLDPKLIRTVKETATRHLTEKSETKPKQKPGESPDIKRHSPIPSPDPNRPHEIKSLLVDASIIRPLTPVQVVVFPPELPPFLPIKPRSATPTAKKNIIETTVKKDNKRSKSPSGVTIKEGNVSSKVKVAVSVKKQVDKIEASQGLVKEKKATSIRDLPKPISKCGAMASALSIAPTKPFKPNVVTERALVPTGKLGLPPDSEPYFPPQHGSKDEKVAQAMREVGCKSPMTEALTIAPQRAYSPLPSATEAPMAGTSSGTVTTAAVFQPIRKPVSMLSALTVAPTMPFTVPGKTPVPSNSLPVPSAFKPVTPTSPTFIPVPGRPHSPMKYYPAYTKVPQPSPPPTVARGEFTDKDHIEYGTTKKPKSPLTTEVVSSSIKESTVTTGKTETTKSKQTIKTAETETYLLPYYQKNIGEIPIRTISPIRQIRAPSYSPAEQMLHPPANIKFMSETKSSTAKLTSTHVAQDVKKDSFNLHPPNILPYYQQNIGEIPVRNRSISPTPHPIRAPSFDPKLTTPSPKNYCFSSSTAISSYGYRPSPTSDSTQTQTDQPRVKQIKEIIKESLSQETNCSSKQEKEVRKTVTKITQDVIRPASPSLWKAKVEKTVQNLSPITVRIPSPIPKPLGHTRESVGSNVHITHHRDHTSSVCVTPIPDENNNFDDLKEKPKAKKTSFTTSNIPAKKVSMNFKLDDKSFKQQTPVSILQASIGNTIQKESIQKITSHSADTENTTRTVISSHKEEVGHVTKERKYHSVHQSVPSINISKDTSDNSQHVRSMSVSESSDLNNKKSVLNKSLKFDEKSVLETTKKSSKIGRSGQSLSSGLLPSGGSSSGDNGTGGGGVGGGKGSVAGSTAPRRGVGVLNPNTGPQARIPLCGQCNKQIRGPFITALGKIWCPDHFVCVNAQCRRPLQDIGFVEENEGLYCEFCFEKYLAPNCSKCNNKIKGDCLNAIGKQFHPECFACTYCNKMFGNNPFFLEDSLPYCETDWNELFTTKCFACGFPIEAGDRWVEALNNNYHSQCFNCTMCKKNLEGQSFYAKGGRPFCKNHAR